MFPFTGSWESPKLETLRRSAPLFISDREGLVIIGLFNSATPEGLLSLGHSLLIPSDSCRRPFLIDLTDRMTLPMSECQIHDLSNGITDEEICSVRLFLKNSIQRFEYPDDATTFLMDNLPSTISNGLQL